MKQSGHDEGDTFVGLVIAAMKDAAVERKLTQLKVAITPEGTKRTVHVRIIVVPESMDMEWPQGLGLTSGYAP